MMNKTSRRTFLTGAATVFAGAAMAQDQVLQDIFAARKRGNWDDAFDAKASTSNAITASHQPIYSQNTIASVEQAIGEYSNIAAQGGWPQVPATKKLKIGVVDRDVEALRRRLMVTGDIPQGAGMSQSFDSYVDAGVKRFQSRHGLPADGVTGQYTFAAMNIDVNTRLGQLQTNLERLRSRPDLQEGGRYVLVNIPAAEIEAVENGRVVQRHTAIVGKIGRPTPLLDSKINEIIVNPYWTAPESIIRKDIIPLMRKDPQYLTKNGIRIFGPDGQEIPPEAIDWSTEEAAKYRLRQDPSKINAMASVKINFPSPENVYMHDTPSQGLFNKLMRFDSSGCVRVQNVRDLVTWILRDTPGWTRQQFEDTIRGGQNTPVNVTNPVPVHMQYVSAWANNGVVQFRDDIYAKDGSAELMLSNAG